MLTNHTDLIITSVIAIAVLALTLSLRKFYWTGIAVAFVALFLLLNVAIATTWLALSPYIPGAMTEEQRRVIETKEGAEIFMLVACGVVWLFTAWVFAPAIKAFRKLRKNGGFLRPLNAKWETTPRE